MSKRSKDKNRIAIITSYAPPVVGGISTYVVNLCDELKKKGIETHIISMQGTGSKDITVFPNRKMIFMIRCFFGLIKLKPYAINAQGAWFTILPALVYRSMHKDTKVICTHHTDPGTFHYTGLKKRLFQKLLSRCDNNVFVSRYLMQRYEIYDIKSNKTVIYSGVRHNDEKMPGEKHESKTKMEFSNSAFDFKKKHKITDDKKIITYIGNFAWKEKSDGVRLLIESLHHMLEQQTKHDMLHNVRRDFDPQFRLMIVGDGKYLEDIKNEAESLEMEDNLIYTGLVHDISLPLMFTDVYAHITFQDAYPLAILEAMIAKKPVIASHVGGIPEMIEDTGILVSNDMQEIATEMQNLLENEDLRKRLSLKGYRRASTQNTWSNAAEQYLKIYFPKE